MNAPRYRYRMLPTETDLNTPPLLANFPEKVLPVGATALHSKPTGGGICFFNIRLTIIYFIYYKVDLFINLYICLNVLQSYIIDV